MLRRNLAFTYINLSKWKLLSLQLRLRALMWKLIRTLFSGSPTGEKPQSVAQISTKPQMNFDAIKSEVEGILKLDFRSEAARELNGELVLNVLHHLDAEIEDVRQEANGYPANPISALVWMNGAGYGNLACALTHHFRNAGWLKREENASALWAKTTLAVCSHYHHMVGPAMLANADCQDRLGNAGQATQMYGGVVKDFAIIADGWLNETDAPTDDDRLALESLQTATERLLSRGAEELDGIDLVLLQSQTKTILSRPSVT